MINVKDVPDSLRIINALPSVWEKNPDLALTLLILLVVASILVISLVAFLVIDKKRVMRINKSDKLLRAVHSAAAIILAAEEGKSFEDSLCSGMELIGRCLDVDRVQIWQNEVIGDELYFVHKYQWLSETGRQKASVPIELKFSYAVKPEWREMFLRGESLNSPFSRLSQSDRNFLRGYDIQSIVIIPLFVQEQFWGFFSSDDCRRERAFTEDEIQILQSASVMIISAIRQSIMTENMQSVAEQLKEALSKTNQANLAKSAFIANMSHEIRTPLNSIIGFSELAIDDNIKPETKEYLENIIKNSNWLLMMINDILDVSKIEAGKLELESVPFDLHDIFIHCRTLLLPKANEKNLDLHFYAEPTIGKMLLGDPTRLRQVFINLLSNAVKFTNIGAVKLSSFITDSDDEHCTICFEVRDSGIGMTPEQIERVFQPFTQADSSMTRLHGGTGLGLAITKNLVSLMKGALTVESMPKVGSKFSFAVTFPTVDIPDYQSGVRIEADNIKKPTFEGEVLICEDNAMNQRVIREHLWRVGLQYETAENGKEAVDIVWKRKEAGEKPFDLILMDIHMPVMDGLEATPKIVELHTGTPIVAMTANIMTNDVQLYEKIGMLDCITKPFTSQDLWRCLLKYFAPVKSPSRKVEDENNIVENDERLQRLLLIDFHKSNRSRCSEIVSAIATKDIKLAHRLVHSLKNNAGQINSSALQRAAADVEGSLAAGKRITEAQVKTLESELTSVIEDIEQALQADASETQAEPLPELYSAERSLELLEKLEPMLQSGNPDCLGFINDLRAIRGSGELIAQMEELNFRPAALAAHNRLRQKLESE